VPASIGKRIKIKSKIKIRITAAARLLPAGLSDTPAKTFAGVRVGDGERYLLTVAVF
jgi:hypothetical protein